MFSFLTVILTISREVVLAFSLLLAVAVGYDSSVLRGRVIGLQALKEFESREAGEDVGFVGGLVIMMSHAKVMIGLTFVHWDCTGMVDAGGAGDVTGSVGVLEDVREVRMIEELGGMVGVVLTTGGKGNKGLPVDVAIGMVWVVETRTEGGTLVGLVYLCSRDRCEEAVVAIGGGYQYQLLSTGVGEVRGIFSEVTLVG